MPINIKRIYEDKDEGDGLRVLVDGMWPRGMKKADAHVDKWFKQVAPSKELRKWFNHDPEKFSQFKSSYKAELDNGEQKEALDKLKQLTSDYDKDLTLLFAAKDETHNQAVVLKEILDHQPTSD